MPPRRISAWYDDVRPGLGARFGMHVDEIIGAILDHPRSFPIAHKDVRRAHVIRFPCFVAYFVDGETVILTSVIHDRRHPRVLRRRRR